MPAHLIGEEGPNRGVVLNLEVGDEWIVGRDPEVSTFVIEEGTVSRRHVRLTRTDEGIYLENLSRINPTQVNDEEPADRILLKEGDRILIGSTIFLYSEDAIPAVKKKRPKKTKKKPEGYDNIFDDLETPEKEEILSPEEEKKPLFEEATEPRDEEPETTGYDTIFDDTGGDEELPFHLISETPLLLKVISGPNAGAEIGIEKGHSYSIGKDPNVSDITFQDLSVSRAHARLSVNMDGVIEIEDLGSKNGTVVNGSLITEKRVITPQDLVATGTTVFLIIDREAPQETIYSPMLQTYEQPKPVEEEPPAPIEAEPKAPFDWKKEPIPTRHLIAGGSILVAFLIIFLSFFSLFKPNGVEVAHKDKDHVLKEALEKFPGVSFSYNPGSGKLFLVGHVLTNVEYQEMLYRLDQMDFVTAKEDNVVIDEGVSRMMNDILQNNADWRGISIRANHPGKFVVAGYVQTNPQAILLSEYLTINFPYLDRLTNEVAIVENLTIQVQSVLNAKGFGSVSAQLNNGDVILSGVYSNKQDQEYHALLKEIQLLHGISGVKNLATPTNPNGAAINISDQYQVSGSSMFDGRGYSAILNGRIYTLGDAVDGMQITSIESNTILLEKDGVKYKINYTR